jgi:hypothetical protein
MAFYLGKYLVEEIEVDREEWFFSQVQHMEETSNPEELRALPEDFDTRPERVQHGSAQWERILYDLLDGFYPTVVPESEFYEIVFYAVSQFYTISEDTDQFYHFAYTPVDLFYPIAGDVDLFYPIQFSTADLFYPTVTPTSDFYTISTVWQGDFFYIVPEES